MARRWIEDYSLVRPEIAESSQLRSCSGGVEEVKAVGVEDEENDKEVIWWRPRSRAENEEVGDEWEEVDKNPLKWWDGR